MRLEEIAKNLGAKLHGDGNAEIARVANLKTAGPDEISFLTDPKYRDVLSETKAGCVIVREDVLPHVKGNALVMKDPYVGFAKCAQLFDTTPPIAVGIHQTAVIEDGAVIGENVGLGPHVVISRGAKIGDGVQLGANVFIGPNTTVGAYTKAYPNVSIYHDCVIGERCLFQSGAVIGSDGFGYANEQGRWVKIPQTGRVHIGNMTEIGACTCIDRGALDDTVIGDNVIIDNLCQIAHAVRVGSGTAIAGCTTIAGSVTVGKYCIIGGTCVLNGHIEICDMVTLTGNSVVMRPIDKPGMYSSGIPVQTNAEWRKTTARYMHLNDLYRKVQDLSKEVKQLRQECPAQAND